MSFDEVSLNEPIFRVNPLVLTGRDLKQVRSGWVLIRLAQVG